MCQEVAAKSSARCRSSRVVQAMGAGLAMRLTDWQSNVVLGARQEGAGVCEVDCRNSGVQVSLVERGVVPTDCRRNIGASRWLEEWAKKLTCCRNNTNA